MTHANTHVKGFSFAVATAGIKQSEHPDCGLIYSEVPANCAGVFTRNKVVAAPLQITRQRIQGGKCQAVLVNSGSANACTGTQGLETAQRNGKTLAKELGIAEDLIAVSSTGVIGVQLPGERLDAVVPQLVRERTPNQAEAVAKAIMTTDLFSKVSAAQLQDPGQSGSILGIAKGAGMIHPNMATMLGFVVTDANVGAELLQQSLSVAVEQSFNSITVDGDTSTNDACVLASTGQSAAHVLDASGQLVPALYQALASVFLELSHAIVRDAEGATRFVTVEVAGAADGDEACRVAFAVAESPLVKTALYAADPNWGRILAAVGRAGIEDLAIDGVSIHLDDVCIVRHGGRAPEYTEEAGQAVMDQQELAIRIDLGRGSALERVWTCDFSHEYVTINAEYRT